MRRPKIKVTINNRMKDYGQEIDAKNGTHTIIINKRLNRHHKAGKSELLDTLYHERLHALKPKLNEPEAYRRTKQAMKRMTPKMKRRLYEMIPKKK